MKPSIQGHISTIGFRFSSPCMILKWNSTLDQHDAIRVYEGRDWRHPTWHTI
jgi:hypothetical protein